jgi:Zn-dependent protease with chaperone function
MRTEGAFVHLAVYLPLLAPLLGAGTAGWLAERLAPRWATWLLATAAVVLAAASGIALTVLAATAIGQLPPVAGWGHWSVAALRRHDPGSIYLELAALLAEMVAVAAGIRFLVRQSAAITAATRLARRLPGDDQLVVLDDPAPDAYAVPGRPGRIVISTGMFQVLDHRERHVLLAHERAHLACRHHLFVTAAQLAAATNPLLRPVAAAVSYTAERWADEHAARVVGDRRLTARTIGKTALLATRHHRPAAALAVTGHQGMRRDLRGTGAVPRRVAALLAPPARRRPVLLGSTVLVLVIASAACIDATSDLDNLFDTASVAPITGQEPTP